MATLLILLSSIFSKCLSVTPLGDWRSGGQASKHYYAGAGSSTACGFINVDSYLNGVPPHPSHDSAFPFGFVSAVGTVPTGSPFDNLFSPNDVTGQGCGACYEIQCIGIWGDAQEGCVCNAETVVVQAIDLSGQNPEPHFDIAYAGFDVIAGPLCGRVAIDYRQVTCDFTDNIYISTDWNDAWSYYLNFYNVAGDGKLCGVELRSNGVSEWMTCSNIGSKWQCDDSNLEPTVLPLSFRLTDCAGQVITAIDVVTAFGAITADLGVNFVYGGGVSTSSTTTTTTTTTTSTTAAPVGGITYPLFVSYVGQIGPSWGDSYNAVLLSNLGVPGYSTHPYNVLNFAFWLSSTNVAALRTAAGSWQNLATFITDTTLRQTLTGSTNPTSAQLRTAIKAIYTANNIKIFLSAFGANDDPMTYGASTVGTNLGSYAKTYLYDGVDVDWESTATFDYAGTGEAWLTALTSALNTELNPTGKSYLISHAPQAPYFMGSTLSQYPRGGYLTVHSNVGHLIDWYNVQFYNQGPSTLYNSYSNMFEASIGWSLNTAVYQMINGDNPESVSIPSSKIVVGKHSLGDGSDFVDGATLKSIFNIALAGSPVWNTGFMCWQFYTENTQSPQFQVANAVVAANWDLTVTAAPTSPTLAPAPTTANPTGNGGGGGCVSGNICVKVKGFASETPTAGSPVWWWGIYDENIIDSLGGGCAISGCADIEIKQSSSNVWIVAYDENGDCSFNMGGDPFTSALISVDVKITSTNGDVVVAAGVVQTTAADTEWDFGSNFGSCTGATANPSSSPTERPSGRPTARPSANPSSSPTTKPSATPTAKPSANPSSSPIANPTAAPIDSTSTPTKSPANDPTTRPTRNPTGSPTLKPSKNPTSSPNARTSTPSKAPTTKPTTNPTQNPAQNDTPNPTKTPTRKRPTRSPKPTRSPHSETTPCISSCTGEANGDYQSCNGCRVFATCSNGIIYDNRACPADLVFDADLKYCGRTSSTCSDSNAFTSGGGGSGATQSLYIVLSVVALLIVCCGVAALSFRCVYKKKRSKTRRKSQEDLANVIQMNDLASYPGPTHVALPSKSVGLDTNTSTDGSQIGFAANTDSGAMLSAQAPAIKALNMVKSYSVSVYSPELKPVPQPQIASQPQDTDNSFVI